MCVSYLTLTDLILAVGAWQGVFEMMHQFDRPEFAMDTTFLQQVPWSGCLFVRDIRWTHRRSEEKTCEVSYR